jgi:hypothetical protein
MKEYLAELVRANPTPAHARNVTREYLQARILGELQRAGKSIECVKINFSPARTLHESRAWLDRRPFPRRRG